MIWTEFLPKYHICHVDELMYDFMFTHKFYFYVWTELFSASILSEVHNLRDVNSPWWCHQEMWLDAASSASEYKINALACKQEIQNYLNLEKWRLMNLCSIKLKQMSNHICQKTSDCNYLIIPEACIPMLLSLFVSSFWNILIC